MSHATAASRPSLSRRRSRGASTAMAIDARYRNTVVRRPQRARPLQELESEPWPNWLIPSALVAVMASMSAYHFDALLAALRSVI